MDRNKSAGRRHGARLALLLLATFVLWGCSAPPKGGRWTRDDYHLGYGYPFLDRATLRDPVAPAGEAGDAAASLQDLSARIWLLSDNQRHELLGAGIRLYRWSLSDMYKACAIRPPQLDLFGQELFAEALDRTDAFVLHLGDACDVSNSVEFALFALSLIHI